MTQVKALVVLLLVAGSQVAYAGGMFLPARGARPLGRAGSFVAGADDAGALYYNPAGMADIDGVSTLFDVGLVFQRTGYDRVDSGGNPQPHVDGQNNLLPIPTLGLTWKPASLRGQWLTLFIGAWTPYLGINSWPENGPQRYSNITLNGSLLAVGELGAAFRVTEWLHLGAGFQIMLIHFHSRVMLSACAQLTCAPEDPGYDSLTQVDTDGVSPSGILGATFLPRRDMRIGLALQLPFWVRSSGTVSSRLPTDPFFTNAALNGSSVSVDFTIPLMARAGFEWRPVKELRLEIGFDYEAWSMQDNLYIKPHGIYISGVPGIGNYYLGTMKVARGMQDSFSVHLGGEWEAVARRLFVRLGYLFETSATPDNTAGVLTPDGQKNMVTAGLGVKVGPMRIDVGYGHIFYADRTTRNSIVNQLNPIQPNLLVPIGNGHYTVDADVVSAGLEGRF